MTAVQRHTADPQQTSAPTDSVAATDASSSYLVASSTAAPAVSPTEETTKPAKKPVGKIIWEFVCKHWFLEGLAVGIAFAAVWPDLGKKGGYIRSEYSVSYGCVMLIFILSGMSLKSKVLLQSLANWKMHLVVQVISLGLTPAIGLGVGKLLQLSSGFDATLAKGIIIACSTPTTISSNVLMTKQAGGDEAGALTNAVIGNVLGVFISPSLIFAYVGELGSAPLNYATTFQNLAITVIGPLIFGQAIQLIFPNLMPWLQARMNLAILNSCLLLVLVWSVFCNTFSENIAEGMNAGSFVAVFLSFWISRIPWFAFSRQATVAIVMCAATKTVALGIPLINIIYKGSPLIGIISAPLLVYHAEQLVVGSFLVSWFAKWIARESEERPLELRGSSPV
ncbi:SBF-like CPA transporter family-domain-containing protein [Chytriomyces cf. hyalinus JEL632]|nr:SBF-like CPA transporter family-domain-containing protein [Chytriomyces cf. hyalinus JEL632]